MPTYEYACRACGEHVEVVQGFSDKPLTACPACGGELRKVFGSVGIVLKGSGFYKNDSRSASTKKAIGSSSPSESTPSSTDGSSGSNASSDSGSSPSAPSTSSGTETKAPAATGASTSS